MKKVPSLSDLEYFDAVVKAGALSRAARALGVQQSTLSVAVQRLESIVGERLLSRGRSGIAPTAEGRRFAARSRELLEKWQDLLLAKAPVGTERISLWCHQSTGLHALKRFIPDLLTEYPAMEISIEHAYAHEITEAILSHRCDLALIVNPVTHHELEISPLYRTYVALWSSPAADLRNPDVLLYDPEMYSVEAQLHAVERKGFRFARKLAVRSLETIVSLVDAGAGRGILPADAAYAWDATTLHLLWEARRTAPCEVSLVSRKQSGRTRLAGKVREKIVERLSHTIPGHTTSVRSSK